MEIVKKFWWVGLLGILAFWFIGMYNGMAAKDQKVKSAWGNVESDYQRRSDLIPNLVSTVKGYANFEQETLTKVIEARASATQVKIDASNLTPENMAAFQQAQSGLSSSLGRLLAVAENYPDLKANQNFLDLQAQLEGTENRISVERMKFNDEARKYNTHIKKFPTNLFAGFFDFDPMPYFEGDEGIEKAPEVQFK